jgi:hypothetical protein
MTSVRIPESGEPASGQPMFQDIVNLSYQQNFQPQ